MNYVYAVNVDETSVIYRNAKLRADGRGAEPHSALQKVCGL
jgi:hypothetical protein